jgi:hypothetical protein
LALFSIVIKTVIIFGPTSVDHISLSSPYEFCRRNFGQSATHGWKTADWCTEGAPQYTRPPTTGEGERMGGWTSEDMYSTRVSALPIIFLWRKRIKSVPLPSYHISFRFLIQLFQKTCFGHFYRALWRKKSAKRGEENSAITLTTTVLYISLFPDFVCQSITIAQRIKSSSVYLTSIIRVSLQPVDRNYI